MGWADIAGKGTTPPAGSVAEYWQPAGGKSPGSETGREAVAKHMKIVMAPANHTYLDQKYLVSARSSVPPSLGMNWACPRGCDVSSAYNWNPGGFVSGVTDRNVIGVEGAMWGETVATMSQRRLHGVPAAARTGRNRLVTAAQRTATSPAYHDFLRRLAAQGARLQAAGVNFYPSTEVPWPLNVSAPPRPPTLTARWTARSRRCRRRASPPARSPCATPRSASGARSSGAMAAPDRRRDRDQRQRHPGEQPVRHFRRAHLRPPGHLPRRRHRERWQRQAGRADFTVIRP